MTALATRDTELRIQCKQLLEMRPDCTVRDLGHAAGLGQSTFSNWFYAVLPGTDDTQKAVVEMLKAVGQGDALRPGNGEVIVAGKTRAVRKAGDFYVTMTVRQIFTMLDGVRDDKIIALCTGWNGFGKTETLAAWQRKNPDSALVTINPTIARNQMAFLRRLAKALELTDLAVGASNLDIVFDAITARLRKEPVPLIFDQCETLDLRLFQLIRSLWDETDQGVGIQIFGTPDLRKTLFGSRRRDAAALTSRITRHGWLEGLRAPEVASIFEKECGQAVEGRVLELLAKAVAGSMRRLMQVCYLVETVHKGRAMKMQTVITMAAQLWGLHIKPPEEE